MAIMPSDSSWTKVFEGGSACRVWGYRTACLSAVSTTCTFAPLHPALLHSLRMDTGQLRSLLAQVSAGAVDVDAAMERMRHLPFEDLGFAMVDHHRALRH